MLFAKKIVLGAVLGLLTALGGCSADNPGTWNQEKVTEYVKESLTREGLEMSEVTMAPTAGGSGFEGTGKVAGGETLKLTVTQDPAGQGLKWDAVGDRGSNFGGSYVLEPAK